MKTNLLLLSAILVAALPCLVIGEDPAKKDVPRKLEPRELAKEAQAEWEKARAILSKAEMVELYSLDPVQLNESERPKDHYYGYLVLGKTEVKDAKDRKKVLDIALGMKPLNGVRCFDPRHGIRAMADGKTVDLVTCYGCSWVYIYFDKQEKCSVVLNVEEGYEELNAILKAAKVPLPTR